MCFRGACLGRELPELVSSPWRTFHGSWPTRSYGMGYDPVHDEWWFPQYTTSSSTTVYRYCLALHAVVVNGVYFHTQSIMIVRLGLMGCSCLNRYKPDNMNTVIGTFRIPYGRVCAAIDRVKITIHIGVCCSMECIMCSLTRSLLAHL